MKTYKTLAKRIKVTGNGKILKRKAGQDHFNSRESGNTTRNKRTDIAAGNPLRKIAKIVLPYHNL